MRIFLLLFLIGVLFSCGNPPAEVASDTATYDQEHAAEGEDDFVWSPEKFADIRIIRYQIPGFEKLNLQQKKLVYYLTQAGLAGRDIIYDQNYRHNLEIRRALERIISNYQGDKNTDDWQAFMLYAKRVFFASGIHHHYSKDKFNPGFSKDYLDQLLKATNGSLSDEALGAIFDPEVDAKKVNLNPDKDLVAASAVNFYDPGITEAEVDAFYQKKMADKDPDEPISYGLNSKLIRKPDGTLTERVWSANGMYGSAIKEIQKWLRLAVGVAENEAQARPWNCWSTTTKMAISKNGTNTTSPGYKPPKGISITSMVL